MVLYPREFFMVTVKLLNRELYDYDFAQDFLI